VTASGLRPSSQDASGGIQPARAVFAFSDGTFRRVELAPPFQLVQLPTPAYARGDINFGHAAQIQGLAFNPVSAQGPQPLPWVAVDNTNGALVGIDLAPARCTRCPGTINRPAAPPDR
jgi:hypothetical protein